MFSKLYQNVKALAAKPAAKIWLAVISFIESSFFPIPADVIFIPMVLAKRNEAYKIAFIATLFSVLGGIFGYFIGLYAYEAFALPMLEMLGKAEKIDYYRELLQQDIYLLWGLLLSSGFVHIPPIKIVTIVSGAAQISLTTFIISAIVSRGIRFYLLAFWINKHGDAINDFLERRLKFITILIFGALCLGYLIYKLAA